jgi:hypothetical protein
VGVNDWFEEWATVLMQRVRREDWPDFESEAGREFWNGTILKMFVRHGVRGDAADRASSILGENPPRYLGEVAPMLLAAIKEAWAEDGPAVDTKTARLKAMEDSKGCAWCEGGGLAQLARTDGCEWDLRTMAGAQYSSRFAVFVCDCAYGRWVDGALRAKSVQERPPLLAKFRHVVETPSSATVA